MTQRLKEVYLNTVIPTLQNKFAYGNVNEVPVVSKIVVNRGLGKFVQNSKSFDNFLDELSIITGQRGTITYSKKAIANFKLRRGSPIGVSVTLRGEKMYAFLDRLINLALPRVRDFRGLNLESFDGFGNFSLGLNEQLMFPEVDYDKITNICGMDISIVLTSKTNEESVVLLSELGFPFSSNNIS
uniref:50S ribosomal protein L5 n=1 Tax=Gymnochlora stellata TaxID=67809 RepID=A0A140JZG0_GYMST|nr:50S ribosomal protein L5 [Gymnochlora stellata]BAU62487.1 50S ribosomal protein L5 [Gymnochlora stellata]